MAEVSRHQHLQRGNMNNKLEINKKEGFTLAELLIVVAIIAVLVAIAIPVFNKQIEKAREAYDIYTMRQAASAAIDLYYAGVNDEASATANGLKWWPDDNPNKRNAAGVYVPTTGKFLPLRSSDDETKKMVYGKKSFKKNIVSHTHNTVNLKFQGFYCTGRG